MPPTLISDFTGADENPLSEGGNWAALTTTASVELQRVSNLVAASSATNCFSYWTPANLGPDLEAYFTFTTVANAVGILFRIQDEGGANTWDGYRVQANKFSNQTIIERVTNAAPTSLITVSTVWASGDLLGARCQGSMLQAWRQPSGSGTWSLAAVVSDTTYASAGKIGIHISNTTARVDDFYVGPMEYFFGGVPPQMPRDPAEFPPRHFGPF